MKSNSGSSGSPLRRAALAAGAADRAIATFHNKFPLLGPLVWTLTLWYYAAQIVVADQWTNPPYRWAENAISDLGDTACPDLQRRLCSPDHSLMNTSFMLIGALMLIGAPLIFQEFRERRLTWLGFLLMGIAGVGTIGVGVFPENEHHTLHVGSAGLPFLLGNVALVVLSRDLDLPKRMRLYTEISGIVGLIGLVALLVRFAGAGFGLGLGLVERVTAYPQTTWLVVFGFYMSVDHYRKRRGRHEATA